MSKILVFDTETGGVTPDKSVLSLGALVGDLETGEVFDAFEVLIKQDKYEVTEKAMQIHKLDLAQCRSEGISPEDAAAALVDLWTNNGAGMLGGHNVEFDVRMVCAQLFQCSRDEFTATFSYRFVDSMTLIRLMTGTADWKSGASLSKALKCMGISMDDFPKTFKPCYRYDVQRIGFHGALYDSVGCFRLMCKFREVLALPENIKRLQP